MYKWSVNNEIVAITTETGHSKLKVLTGSIRIKIFVISEDIMKPFLGCTAKCKKTKKQTAY